MGQRKRHPKLNRGGFTLIEVLLTVGILAVLLTVTMPNLVQTQKELRQTGLDARAQVLYTAVQNQLLKLRADGRAGEYAHLATETNGVRNAGSGEIDGRTVDLCYLSSQDRGMDAVDLVMAPGVAEEELRDADWVVVYEPEGGSVVDVFFSESGALDYGSRPGHFNGLRGDWAVRLADGATVGWYGGGALIAPSQRTEKLEPTITVDNGEQLIVYFRCKKPVKNAANHLEFQISLSDREGHAWSYNYTYTSGSLNWDVTTDVYSVGLLLDDLTGTEGRFDHVLGSASTMPEGQKLTPGYLKAEVTVTCPTDPSMESGYAQAETNSLFADGSTEDTAYISCCRHLQNLDASSGVDSKIKTAIQRMPLSFEDDPGRTDDWYDCYHGSYFNGLTGGTANFKPIQPAGLTSYNGNRLKIEGLTVDSQGQGGLFFSGTGFTWKNMILASPQVYARETTIVENGKDKIIAHSGALTAVAGNNCLFEGITVTDASVHSENVTKGSSNAGGLVGQVVGAGTVIRDCNVYLDPEKLKDSGKTDSDIWISGRNCGGLVGNVTTGPSLGVEDSFASTVVGIKADKNADVSAGGLVGELGGGAGLTLTRSYADCYLYGSRTGGLVAETKNGDAASRVSMTSCYAAGFQSASSAAAGLVNGLVGDASRCYTISNMTMTDKTDMYGVARESSGTVNNVYYAQAGRYDALPGTSPIVLGTLFNDLGGSGAGFRRSVLGTEPYYLRSGLDLSNYPCPQLKADGKALIHYGDWLYEKTKYTVTFMPNGGSGYMAPLVTELERLTSLPACGYTRTGYTFGGWTVDQAGMIAWDGTCTTNPTVYAKWNRVSTVDTDYKDFVYHLHLESNGGALYLSRTEYMSQYIELHYVEPFTLLTVGYSRHGLRLVSWTTEADGSGTTYYPGQVVSRLGKEAWDKVYLYAQWERIHYTVNFECGDYGPVQSKQLVFGEPWVTPAPPANAPEGMEFWDWYDPRFSTGYAANTQIPEGDLQAKMCFREGQVLTLYARWVPKGQNNFSSTYTLKLDPNGHSFSVGDVTTDDTQPMKDSIALTEGQGYLLWGEGYSAGGKKLVSWNTRPDGMGTRYECGQIVRDLAGNGETVTLYAQWEDAHYWIQFEGFGEPGQMDPIYVSYSETATLPEEGFQENPGVRFSCWRMKKQSWVTYYPGDQISALSSGLCDMDGDVITFQAIWEQKGYLTFNYDYNDRGTLAACQFYGEDHIDPSLLPAIPAGRELDGWYTSGGVKVLDAEGKVAGENVDGFTQNGVLIIETGSEKWKSTLYARWKSDTSPEPTPTPAPTPMPTPTPTPASPPSGAQVTYTISQRGGWDGNKIYEIFFTNLSGKDLDSVTVTLQAHGNVTGVDGNVSGVVNGDKVTVTFTNFNNKIKAGDTVGTDYLLVNGTGDFWVE